MTIIKKLVAKVGAFFASLVRTSTSAGTSPGDASIRMLLLHLCNGDADRAIWIMRWLAYPMRHPGAKMETALVVDGIPGAGASLFFSHIIAPMHGQHASVASILFGRSRNDWARGIRYAVIAEFANTRKSLMSIKSMLLTTSLSIRAPYDRTPTIVPNEVNFVFLSAPHPDLVDSRHFCILTPATHVDHRLRDDVLFSIENGGLVDFYKHLMTGLDMGDFNERTPVHNSLNAGEVCYE